MEKALLLYKTVNGVATPFPSAANQLKISAFTYSAARMGGAPTITATIKNASSLDGQWIGVYVTFNNENFYVRTEPDNTKENTDARESYSVTFYSQRYALDNVYMIDAVQNDSSIDGYQSNSTKVQFMGDIDEWVARLNASFVYSGLYDDGWTVVKDSGVSSEDKMMSFENKFVSEALQEGFTLYGIPYYFVGKTIHIGNAANIISTPFAYGAANSLLSVAKNNSNYKIVNRCSGYGSSDNIPYYYPNQTAKGTVTATADSSNVTLQSSHISVINPEKFANKVKENSENITYVQPALTVNTLQVSLYNSSTSAYEYMATSASTTLGQIKGLREAASTEHPSTTSLPYKIVVNASSATTYKIILGAEVYLQDKGFTRLNSISLDGVDITTSVTFDTTDSSFTVYLQAGSHTFLIDAQLNLDFPYYSQTHSGFNIQVSSSSSASPYWTKGTSTTLTDLSTIGIKISSSVTPTNGDKFHQTVATGSYIAPVDMLMPPIFRSSSGEDRFYNALNNTYQKPDGSGYYSFNNPYDADDRREQVVSFDEIKPTITGMTNAASQPMDRFIAFAWDNNDNDEIDPDTGKYVHPYFFGKLPKFDGTNGFNLFDCSSESGNMTVSMTSGTCGSCQFEIHVGEETQKNTVQVDSSGNLLRNSNGEVRCGCESLGQPKETPQDRQNDTVNYEVWVALAKDTSTYPVVMPSYERGLVPTANTDTFVLLNISLPSAYITAAEERLEEAIIAYMAENNDEKFNFAINFSRIYLEENPSVLLQLNENAQIKVSYHSNIYTLFISNFSYSMKENEVLPEISVELAESLSTSSSSLQLKLDAVKTDILGNVNTSDPLKSGLKYFLRKDVEDTASGLLHFKSGATFGLYADDAQNAGGAVTIDSDGNSHAVFDYVTARKGSAMGSVDYDDLVDKPAINGHTLDKNTQSSNLEISYNDLDDLPTIPAEQVNADWDAISGKAQILNKPSIPDSPLYFDYTNTTHSYTAAEITEFVDAISNLRPVMVSSQMGQGSNGAEYIAEKVEYNATSGQVTIVWLNASNEVKQAILSLNATAAITTLYDLTDFLTSVDLANYYTKSQTYNKTEIDDLIPENLSDLNNDEGFITEDEGKQVFEQIANMDGSISPSSSASHYPSSLAVYNAIKDFKQVYVCTVNSTAYVDASTAYSAGKTLIAQESLTGAVIHYTLVQKNDSSFYFLSAYKANISGASQTLVFKCLNASGWSETSYNLDNTGTTNYNDLANKPQINGNTLQGDIDPADLGISYNDLDDTPSLATVATSGLYSDLSGRPTIPASPLYFDYTSVLATTQTEFNALAEAISSLRTVIVSSQVSQGESGGEYVATSLNYNASASPQTITMKWKNGDVYKTTTVIVGRAPNTISFAYYEEGSLATVASTGDYDDLDNQPSINGYSLSGEVSLQDIGAQPEGNYELTSRKVTSVSESSTDVQYPSALCLYNASRKYYFSKTTSGTATTALYNEIAAVISARVPIFIYDSDEQASDKIIYPASALNDAQNNIITLCWIEEDGGVLKVTIQPSHTITYTEIVPSGVELQSNKTLSVSSSSTDTQYPSAKAVYTAIQSEGSSAKWNGKYVVGRRIPKDNMQNGMVYYTRCPRLLFSLAEINNGNTSVSARTFFQIIANEETKTGIGVYDSDTGSNGIIYGTSTWSSVFNETAKTINLTALQTALPNVSDSLCIYLYLPRVHISSSGAIKVAKKDGVITVSSLDGNVKSLSAETTTPGLVIQCGRLVCNKTLVAQVVSKDTARVYGGRFKVKYRGSGAGKTLAQSVMHCRNRYIQFSPGHRWLTYGNGTAISGNGIQKHKRWQQWRAYAVVKGRISANFVEFATRAEDMY